MSLFNWTPGMTVEELEKSAILQAYKFYQGNKTVTARALGVSIRTLETRLEKYGEDQRAATARDVQERTKADAFLRRQRGLPALRSDDAGLRPESFEKTSEEQSLSMPKRKEIQSVLPPQASGFSNGKRR